MGVQMQMIAKFTVKATKAYAKAENRDKSYVDWNVQIEEASCGKFLVSVWNAKMHTISPNPYKAVFDTLDAAKADANRVWCFVRDEWTGTTVSTLLGVDDKGHNMWHFDNEKASIPGNDYKITLCPTCDHVNTLVTTQEAYGDSTTCTNCDYSRWYSIGD